MKGRLVVACLVAAFLAGCGNLFDTAAAVVGGHKITVQEVSRGLEEFKETEEYRRLAQQGNISAIQRQVEQAYLGDLIRRAVLEPEAEERGIEATDEEVADQIDAIRAEFGDENTFEEQLKERGLTLARLEQIVHDNLLEDELRAEVTAGSEPSEAEVEAYYDENIADYTSMRSQHILVESFEEARDISNQLQNAPENGVERLFEQLARRHSTDQASANNGGDLGFTDAGELVEQYEAAAAELEIGEVSDPVQSQFGYHVIRVLERRTRPLEEVADAISDQIGQGAEEEAWQEWLRDAYERADIKINSRYGVLDVETQQVVDATSEDLPGAVETPTPTPTG